MLTLDMSETHTHISWQTYMSKTILLLHGETCDILVFFCYSPSSSSLVATLLLSKHI